MASILQLLSLHEDAEWITNYMSYTMIGVGCATFIALQFQDAPYGKHVDSRAGPVMNPKLGWLFQEMWSVIIPLLLLVVLPCKQMTNPVNVILLTAFCGHYFQRSFIYPFLIRGGKPLPIFTCFMAVCFVCFNGLLQGLYLTTVAVYDQNNIFKLTFVFGIVMFVTGMYINCASDAFLRNLRKPNDTGYHIPRGGLFTYVSGANFFGEVLEWWGFAVASWSLPACAFAIFTTANLIPRAFAHHRWYKTKFKETYPAERKAIIPFLL